MRPLLVLLLLTLTTPGLAATRCTTYEERSLGRWPLGTIRIC